MPRQLRDASLETRTARGRLKVRKDPHYRLIESGLHLGYRKLASGPGTWVRRQYDGARYRIENLRTPAGKIVIADDYAEADGREVMSFAQAQAALRQPLIDRRAKRYTVADAVADYLTAKAADGRDVADATIRAKLHILPALGEQDCANLSTEELRKWHRNLANTAPRRRERPRALSDRGRGDATNQRLRAQFPLDGAGGAVDRRPLRAIGGTHRRRFQRRCRHLAHALAQGKRPRARTSRHADRGGR